LSQSPAQGPRKHWHLAGEVFCLADVLAQVIHLNLSRVKKLDGFPILSTNGARRPAVMVMRVMPKERLSFQRPCRRAERWKQTHTVKDLVPGRQEAGGLQERGIEIDRNAEPARFGSGAGDAGPADNQRHSNPAFVEGTLLVSQRPIRGP